MSAREGPRARAHPGAIACVWAWQAGIGIVAAWPGASLVRAVLGGAPRGDAGLWEPGGAALLDLAWRHVAGLTASADGALLVLLVGALAGWPLLAVWMAAMAQPPGRARAARVAVASLRALPAFVRSGAAVLLAQGAAIGVGTFLAMLVEGWVRPRLGEATAQALQVATVLPFAGAALAMGLALDLARAAIVLRRVGAFAGLARGFRTYRAAPLAITGSWGARAIASLAPVALAGAVATRLGGQGGASLALLAAVHQAAVLARVALRASWLACAMRTMAQPAPSDR